MSKKTKIDWCDSTWNPVTGCLNGCKYCYAEKIANRFSDPSNRGLLFLADDFTYETSIKPKYAYPYGFRPSFHRYRLDEPEKMKKSSKIFVVSMGDLFGDWVPDEWIQKVFDACKKAPWHKYLFLTKNPKRYMQVMLESDPCTNCEEYLDAPPNCMFCKVSEDYKKFKNQIWLGAAATNKNQLYEANKAFFDLSDKTENLFYSIEPLCEEMCDHMMYDYEYGQPFDWCKWVIIGAETGNRKDKIVPKKEWVQHIVDQCRAADVPVFMKDNLAAVWGDDLIREYPEGLKDSEDTDKMKAWQVNECDIVAARTAEEALEWYLEETGVNKEDCYSLNEIHEVKGSMQIYAEDRETEVTTVIEILNSLNFCKSFQPSCICSTEY